MYRDDVMAGMPVIHLSHDERNKQKSDMRFVQYLIPASIVRRFYL